MPVSLVTELLSIPKWSRAAIETLSALAIGAFVVGIWFLPTEVRKLLAKPVKQVIYCVPTSDGKAIFSLIDKGYVFNAGRANTCGVQWTDLSSENRVTQEYFPDFDTRYFALDEVGSRLFAGDSHGSLHAVNLGVGPCRVQPVGSMHKGYPFLIECSMDGTTLVTVDMHCLTAWNVEQGNKQNVAPKWRIVDRTIYCVALSPDSRTGVFCRVKQGQSELVEFNLSSGETRVILKAVQEPWEQLVISPNSQLLAAAQTCGEVTLLQIEQAEECWREVSISGLASGTCCIIRFSPQSDCLVTSNDSNTRLQLWDLTQKRLLHTFLTTQSTMLGCRFLNDEQVLAWGLSEIRVAAVYPPFSGHKIEF